MLWFLLGCIEYRVSITPVNPTTADVLSVRVQADKETTVTISDVAWYREGLLTVDARELSPNWTTRGEEWTAEVTLDNGDVLKSNKVTIGNSLPDVSIEIIPEIPTAGYPVECRVTTSDADDDTVAFAQYWSNADGRRLDLDTISPGDSTIGEWTCTVEADDGYDVVTDSTTVEIVDLPDLPEDEGALLVNTSFESPLEDGGWMASGCQRVGEAREHFPYEGAWMLYGGQDECEATQVIDLLAEGYAEQHIDAQRLRVHIDGYLANSGPDDDHDDQVRFRIVFLDADQVELGTLDSLFAGEQDWVYRDAQRMMPIGTRYLQVTVLADWRSDRWNDSFADAIDFRIEQAVPAEPLLMKEPMLQDYRQDAMKIIWETDGVDHDPEILWGENLENRVTNIRSTWIDEDHIVHVGVIEGLEPNQTVRYQVPVQDFEPFEFTTAPNEGDDFSMIWLGDNQEAYARFTQHVGNFAPKDPDMLFVVGDLVQWGSNFEEWDSMWWEPLQVDNFAQKTPILAARGNHDMDHPYSYAYVDLPGDGSAYSFLYGDVWILVLNTHADMQPSNDPNLTVQYDFIVDALQSEEAQNAAFRLVAFHQAPYSNSSASSTPDQIYGNANAQTFWVPLFEQYDVDSVISGHYHSYQRGERNGIQYLVTGGGGSTLLVQEFDVWDWLTLNLTYQYTLMVREGNQLRWETYDLNENLIDSWVITQ
jgi:predicted phosphodiesterase